MVPTCVQVAVLPASTRTSKAVLKPFAKQAARGAKLTAISWIDIHHAQAMRLRLVFQKHLQLVKRPAVQTGSCTSASFDPFANIFQIFKNDDSCVDSKSFFHNLFAHFMIHLSHPARFSARDCLQQLFCRLRTVGLKPAPKGEKLISLIADPASANQLTAAHCSGIIFSEVYPKQCWVLAQYWIGKIQNKVEIPFAFFTNQFRFFMDSFYKIGLLKLSDTHFYFNTLIQGVQRKRVAFNRIGSFIEVHTRALAKQDFWNFFAFIDIPIFICFADSKESVADHLRAQRGLLSDFRVTKVMQGDAIPTPIFYRKRNDLIASFDKSLSQSEKLLMLLGANFKFDRNSAFHKTKRIFATLFKFNRKRGARFLPALKDGVSACQLG